MTKDNLRVAEGPRRRRSTSDPLSAAMRPPEDETQEEFERRLNSEKEARLISENIDEMLRKDGIERKKSKAEVNVLLLGQSESGKSTTLKRKSLCYVFIGALEPSIECVRFLASVFKPHLLPLYPPFPIPIHIMLNPSCL